MLTGPNYEDGTGWSLCEHQEGGCRKCMAEYGDLEDALATLKALRPNCAQAEA